MSSLALAAALLAATSAGCELPGAPAPAPPDCARRLAADAAWAGEEPRTRHLDESGGPRFTNRLALESSPYLRQHAHNPVDWYPWGEEAFAAARRLSRPVLLSIGYSTCHWCHVMEEESFEDLEIAEYLNRNYIAIKVDREERPDLDAIYMAAVQALTGRGGWPMTTWLTADGEPFYGGTYFPARDGDRGQRTGFLTLLRSLRDAHAADPERITARAGEIAATIRKRLGAGATRATLGGREAIEQTVRRYLGLLDRRYGGVRGAPKFPATFPVRLMLRYHALHPRREDALDAVVTTLDGMADGGLRDPIGGGFHRYATKESWSMPHFEKMLYDNAQLAVVYLEGWQASGDDRYRRIARETLDYLLREMRSPRGTFHSATDADSPAPDGEHEEGRFFTWTPGEVRAVLGDDAGELAMRRFGIEPPCAPEGRCVPRVSATLAELAAEREVAPEEVAAAVEEARTRLYAARAKRPPPFLDDKVLTAWNGLAVGALARVGFALEEARYVEAAERAAAALLAAAGADGRLPRTARGGAAFLDDYAFLVAGLLDLYEATGGVRWLDAALRLQRIQDRDFGDPEGAYFRTADDHERLLARERPLEDGAMPSANAVSRMNLLRFAELTGDASFVAAADRIATHATGMLLADAFRAGDPREVVIVHDGRRRRLVPFLDVLRRHADVPHVLVLARQAEIESLAERLSIVAGKRAGRDGITAYVCQAGVCRLPTSDPARFEAAFVDTTTAPEPRKK